MLHSKICVGVEPEEVNEITSPSFPAPSPAVKELEVAAVKKAEEGDLGAALVQLNQAVELAPNYASLYNNRAQVSTCILCIFHITKCAVQVFRLMDNIDAAQTDLQTAIELSGGRGTAAAQAHTQRGLILMLRGNEEQALEDFKVNLKVLPTSMLSSYQLLLPGDIGWSSSW